MATESKRGTGRLAQSPEAPEVDDEIDFWAQQIGEHAYFLYLGLVDDGSNGAGKFKEIAGNLANDWADLQALQPGTRQYMALLRQLLADQAGLEANILAKLNRNQWLGYLYPSYVQHTIEERQWLERLLSSKPPTAEERIAFWNAVNRDHAAVEAQMMDPKETKSIAELDGFRRRYDDLLAQGGGDYEQFVMLSLTAAQDLDRLHWNSKLKKPKSTIHPVLLEHVIREGQRSIEELRALQASMFGFRTEVPPEGQTISTYSGTIQVPPPATFPPRRR